MRAIWFCLGLIALLLGLAGIPLPLLPTVPFLLLATFCFARSSPRLHQWLVTHPVYGPSIRDWQENGAISRRAKRLATMTIIGSLVISIGLNVPATALGLQAGTLCLVLIFIWTRPSV
ncbi:YbaN family protein [Mangrovicoccus algicola]|uniref:YbaN family protein n=1 Tax=Mangrovicoccus algicola TaxID=2771008 RepID=A0A8J7CZQ8_9RHOB|nr:YbaN family protein [Mangrovicoccus algicola]MBE3638278.1 YbaN family protein [Mangrovicoccus algicola]